jgi:hypothetical protein
MNILDDHAPIDHDKLIDVLYELQVSLKILAEQMARDRQPDINRRMLQTIANLHWFMGQNQPSLRRH